MVTVFTKYDDEVNNFNWKSKHAKCRKLRAWLLLFSVIISLLIYMQLVLEVEYGFRRLITRR